MGEDTLSGNQVRVDADLVIFLRRRWCLPTEAPTWRASSTSSAAPKGFFTEAHPKLRPVETNTAGVYLAGVAQGPKDIPDTVAQAGAAASKVVGLLARGRIESNPMLTHVDVSKCSGCGSCVDICPYHALSLDEITVRENSKKVTRTVAKVNEGLCQGCGACTVACRPGALDPVRIQR